MICSVCGEQIRDDEGRTGAGGLPVCSRCYHLPCLWMPDRPDCVAFAEQVHRAREQEQAWGVSDLRIKGAPQ